MSKVLEYPTQKSNIAKFYNNLFTAMPLVLQHKKSAPNTEELPSKEKDLTL